MTELELEGGLTADHFALWNDGSSGKHTLKSLPRYLRCVLPSWKKDFKKNNKKISAELRNSPRVIIICSSAIRAVEVMKFLSEFRVSVAKLFAKHLKVKDQVEMLKNYHPIAVGTPN